MDNSVFIAKILGPVLIAIPVGMVANQKFYRKVMEDYLKNAAVVFFTAIAPLAVGITIVLTHNVWKADWTVIITIFGWCAVIKGLWSVIFPNTLAPVISAYSRNKVLLAVHSAVAFIFGAVLTAFGYFIG